VWLEVAATSTGGRADGHGPRAPGPPRGHHSTGELAHARGEVSASAGGEEDDDELEVRRPELAGVAAPPPRAHDSASRADLEGGRWPSAPPPRTQTMEKRGRQKAAGARLDLAAAGLNVAAAPDALGNRAGAPMRPCACRAGEKGEAAAAMDDVRWQSGGPGTGGGRE
jgi:hypothetical protein